MVTAHQKIFLTIQGDENAPPEKAFNQDLLAEITKWRQEGNTVYLGIGASSNINEAELSNFIAEAKLYDLMNTNMG
eukprot:6159891-Ditylum_brightwellii.AAC.1